MSNEMSIMELLLIMQIYKTEDSSNPLVGDFDTNELLEAFSQEVTVFQSGLVLTVKSVCLFLQCFWQAVILYVY